MNKNCGIINHSTPFAFIPCRLDIPEHPELSNFPYNVLFSSFKTEDEKLISGNAIYIPVFDSFEEDEEAQKMTYRNSYGGASWLVIIYRKDKESYSGEKYINGKLIGVADGNEWKWFFVHFTALGLSSGEVCQFNKDPP